MSRFSRNVIGAFFLAPMAALTGCEETPPPKAEIIRPIEWIRVEGFGLGQVRRLSGIVQPIETAALSFEVAGKIAAVPANLGDRVRRGELLARLDTKSFQLNVDSAQGQLRNATASLNEAQAEFDRKKALFEKRWVAQSALDNATRALDSARSGVDIAVAQLDIAQKSLNDSELRAPYEGVITERRIEPSQQISAGQVVFEIEGDEGLEIVAAVPETIIDEVRRYQIFDVGFPAARLVKAKAQVAEVGARAESGNTFPVTLVIDKPDPALRAGMTAEVDFFFEGEGRTGHTGATARVPVSAVAAGLGDDDAFVFVFDEGAGVVTKRSVQTENIIGNDVLISEGLEPGEVIAAGGVTFLRDGQKVELLDRAVRRFN